MKREPFASAAGARWRRHRALALLAAGLAPDVENGARGSQIEQAITARIRNCEDGLPWRLDQVAARGTMLSRIDHDRMARLVAGVPAPCRSIAIRHTPETDAVDAWAFFASDEEAGELRAAGWRFWVMSKARELHVATRPPFIIGYTGGLAEEVAQKLAEDEDLPSVFGVAPIARATPRCEIQIVVGRDFTWALDYANRTSAAIEWLSCDLAIVMLREGLPERPRNREVVDLRDALGANGIIVGRGDAEAALTLARHVIRDLAAGKPLWEQRLATQAGPALLLCDDRMTTHKLTSWTPPAEDGTPVASAAEPPAYAGTKGKRFAFLPDLKSVRRDKAGAGKSRAEESGVDEAGAAASESQRAARKGPRRGKRGRAPLETRRGGDALGMKLAGAPDQTGASGWFEPRRELGGGDELPPNPHIPEEEAEPRRVQQPGDAEGPDEAQGLVAVEEPVGDEDLEDVEGFEEAVDSSEEDLAEEETPAGEVGGEPGSAAEGGGATALRLDDDAVRTLVLAVHDAAHEIARDSSKYEGLRAPGTPGMLRKLARTGGALRHRLSQQGGGLPARTARVQLVSARPGGILPIEYLYDLEPPDDDAPICEHAEEGLRAERSGLARGWCATCDPSGRSSEEQRRILCPLAFWGASRVIERCHVEPEEGSKDDGEAFIVAGEASGEHEGALHPLRCAMTGVTDRMDPADSAAISERLGASAAALVEAEDWSDWEYGIKRTPTPGMLVLVARKKQDARNQTPQLEIGIASTLGVDRLRLAQVRPDEDAPPPLAILLGWETSLDDDGFEHFALSFEEVGAVVVSTMAAVTGSDTARVVNELTGAIARTERSVPLVTTVAEARRRLLADGTPAVLSLVALGEAGDWDVDGSTA